MDPKYKNTILSLLPENEREEAEYLIDKAVMLGWEHIGLLTYDEPATILDLVGNAPCEPPVDMGSLGIWPWKLTWLYTLRNEQT